MFTLFIMVLEVRSCAMSFIGFVLTRLIAEREPEIFRNQHVWRLLDVSGEQPQQFAPAIESNCLSLSELFWTNSLSMELSAVIGECGNR